MKSLRKQLWNMQRFGVTPGGLLRRVVPGDQPPVLILSLPKSGTHLVERAVCLWPQCYRVLKPTIRRRNVERYGGLPKLLGELRAGQVLVAHAGYSAEIEEAIKTNGVRAVFSCRDLRAVLASWTHHVVSLKTHHLHGYFKDIEDPRERMKLIMKGDDQGRFRSMASTFEGHSGWLDSVCHVVRFEDLVGESGGGTLERQNRSLNDLWDYLGLPEDPGQRQLIRDRVFSDASPTFRAGGKVPWMDAFDDELIRLFDTSAGDLLSRYGYSGDQARG